MAPAETRGDDRTKPRWGGPPPVPAGPSPADGTAARLSKAEVARLARQQAKAARAEAKAARAEARRGRRGAAAPAPAARATAAAAALDAPAAPAPAAPGQASTAGTAPAGPPRFPASPFAAPSAPAAPAPGASSGDGTPAAAGAAAAIPVAAAAAKPTAAEPAARSATKGAARGTKADAERKPAGGARAAARGAANDPKAGSRAARARAFRKRYAVVHDVDGPRVRLGVLWFLLALVGIFGGAVGTAIVYGAAAAIAAAQTARAWRKQKARPHEAMAAAGAAVVAVGASVGAGGAGLGLFGAVALAFVGAAGDTTSRNPRLADVGWTLQAALPPALVAMSMVLLTRLDQGSAIALLLLVSAFDTGDFLIGSGARNPYEGPAAGVAAIVVITFIVSTLPISTLSFGQAWLLGGAVAVLAPAGQLAASALLPSAAAPASALRRLDSLVLAAPLWAWAVGLFE